MMLDINVASPAFLPEEEPRRVTDFNIVLAKLRLEPTS